MAQFEIVSREFRSYLRSLEHEKGFSKVLKEASIKTTQSPPENICGYAAYFDGLFKEDLRVSLLDFRGMTYFFNGPPHEVEERVRALPLGRAKTPPPKQLVKLLALRIQAVLKAIRWYRESLRTNIAQVSASLEANPQGPNARYLQDMIKHYEEELQGLFEPEPPNVEDLKRVIYNARYPAKKEAKELKGYLVRPEVDDAIVLRAWMIAVAGEVMEA